MTAATLTTKVVLADDQALIRAGFRALVDSAEDLEVVGEAADGAEAVAQVRATSADVVVMDIRMPGVDGLEATRRIGADPALSRVRILILTTFESDEYVVDALRAGASGFLGKGVGPTELLDGIRTVAAGEALLSARATRALIGRYLAAPPAGAATGTDALAGLTEREREVVAQVALGLSNTEIGARLYLSPLTVKTHVSRAMAKIGARDRAQVVVAAFQSGLVVPGQPGPGQP